MLWISRYSELSLGSQETKCALHIPIPENIRIQLKQISEHFMEQLYFNYTATEGNNLPRHITQ